MKDPKLITTSTKSVRARKLNLEINEAYTAPGVYKPREASRKTALARNRAYEDAINRFEAGVINSFDFNQIRQRFDVATSDVVRVNLTIFLN